jgi:serpin B
MNKKDLYRAIGGIDEKFIAEAETDLPKKVPAFPPALKWALPLAACFVIIAVIALPNLIKPMANSSNGAGSNGADSNGVLPPDVPFDEFSVEETYPDPPEEETYPDPPEAEIYPDPPEAVSLVSTEIKELQDLGIDGNISEAEFAFKLGEKLIAQNPKTEENFLYSPLSVWLPLAALTNAVDDMNRPALLEALGAKDATQEQINNYAQTILYRVSGEINKLYMENYQGPLKIANALFVSDRVTANQVFAQSFADNYLGQVFSVNFSAQYEAADRVNAWASEKTEGLIDRVVEPSAFNEETVAAIANAIYFSDRWKWEFKEERTAPGPFRAASGEVTANYMIREGDEQLYFEDDRIQAMPLHFLRDGDMWIILPKFETANGFLQSMTVPYFSVMQRYSNLRTGKLLLPKFEAENQIDLVEALQDLDVSIFTNELERLIENGFPVGIGSATQKTAIKVDEKGTTAAAVTVMVAPGATLPEQTEPFEMVCDKPFAFVLEKDGQILFMGAVNKPES